ncbi:hypothetical protein WBQ96_18990 [Mesorhizobium sp. CCNWLY176]
MLIGATDRELEELAEVISNAAEVITEAFDWQALRRVKTFTGDAIAESFTLPSDYDRMLKKSRIWSSRWRWAMTQITNSDEWLEAEIYPYVNISGIWTIFGDAFQIKPIMATGETAKFFYITNETVVAEDASLHDAFSADTDRFVLSEKLLRLCAIYLWKQAKGLDFAAELADYEQLAAQLMDKDGGAKPTVSGNLVAWPASSNVWPGSVTG